MIELHSRIRIIEEACDIAIAQSSMYGAYIQLDMLKGELLDEICFVDSASKHKLYLRRYEDYTSVTERACVFMTGNDIESLKRLISQCYQHPYDRNWLHCDLDVRTAQDTETTLYIHLD